MTISNLQLRLLIGQHNYKCVPNKVTTEAKNKLVKLIDGTIDELSSTNLTVSNKIKLLEIALNYTLTKLAHTYKEVDNKQKSFRVEYVGKTVDYNPEKN